MQTDLFESQNETKEVRNVFWEVRMRLPYFDDEEDIRDWELMDESPLFSDAKEAQEKLLREPMKAVSIWKVTYERV